MFISIQLIFIFDTIICSWENCFVVRDCVPLPEFDRETNVQNLRSFPRPNSGLGPATVSSHRWSKRPIIGGAWISIGKDIWFVVPPSIEEYHGWRNEPYLKKGKRINLERVWNWREILTVGFVNTWWRGEWIVSMNLDKNNAWQVGNRDSVRIVLLIEEHDTWDSVLKDVNTLRILIYS